MNFIKQSFSGGMNLRYDPTRIGADEYPVLINGRNRNGTVEPIRRPVQLEAPAGRYQGLYAADKYALLLVDGKAYLRNFEDAGSHFQQVANINLDASVDTIFAELVPDTTMKFLRIPDTAAASGPVTLRGGGDGGGAGALLQDGITQPHVIDADGVGRICKTYQQWATGAREYVPIGRQMLFYNGILYLVSADGRTIYRSVDGRPLDFMVNVQPVSGDKLPTEEEGGATSTSHAVGFDVLTCISALNTEDGGFFAGSRRLGVSVVPDFDKTIFDQPTFDDITLFPTGPVNQFSFVESNGDHLFLTTKGIRSFNAALQLKNEGKNSPLSARVQRLFKNQRQTRGCVVKFDDYVLFGVSTIYGNGVLLYDETAQRFIGLDIHAGVGQVKQFAAINTDNVEKLLFITTDNKIYEAYAGDVAPMQLYIGDFCSQQPSINQHPTRARIVVINAEAAGTLTATPYVDGKKQTSQSKQQSIEATVDTSNPQQVPFGNGANDTVRNLTFDFRQIQQGWKWGLMLELNCQAEISHVELESVEETQITPLKQEVRNYASAA